MLYKEVIIKLTDDFDGEEVFDYVKDVILEDYDEIVDWGNQNGDSELTEPTKEGQMPCWELPLVIQGEFHLVHALSKFSIHCDMHDDAGNETSESYPDFWNLDLALFFNVCQDRLNQEDAESNLESEDS